MEARACCSERRRNGKFAMPSSSYQPSRKEWRVVTEHSIRNSGDEGLDRPKLVQSDERFIYEVVKPVPVSDHGIEIKNTMSEHYNLAVNVLSFDALANFKSLSETTTTDTASSFNLSDTLIAVGNKNNFVGKPGDSYLLDERALLASIARTIGSGVRISISNTLPNRLAKMLAPLHWHDYKRKYGKLNDFVVSHSELFSIEGDCIQLPEGAQKTIAATAAEAAAAPSLYSSLFPSVSVTPMAPPLESSYVNPTNGGRPSQFSSVHPSQNLNGGPPHQCCWRLKYASLE